MTTLEYDIANPDQAKGYPAHGWAINSQGVKLLWCPFLRLVEESLRTKRISGALPAQSHTYAWPFIQTFQNLAVTLRELHRAMRLACEHLCTAHTPEALTANHRAIEIIPLYVDLAFIYLRRLPDRLVVSCRPLLFEHWHSVPRTFKAWLRDIDGLEDHKPSCDFDILRSMLIDHSRWFDRLREKSHETGKKGMRDALEHRNVTLMVQKSQVGSRPPSVSVMIDSQHGDVETHKDVLPQIRASVDGLCRLMTGIHSATDFGRQYEFEDHLRLLGTDDDSVGFWPQIST